MHMYRTSQAFPVNTFPYLSHCPYPAAREPLVACNVGISGSLDAAVEGKGTSHFFDSMQFLSGLMSFELHGLRISKCQHIQSPKLPVESIDVETQLPPLRRDQRTGQKSSSSGLSTISLSWGDAWAREAGRSQGSWGHGFKWPQRHRFS